MRLVLPYLLAALVALAGCGQEEAALRNDASAPPLLGAWELIEGRVEDEPLTPPAGARATLVVEEETLGGTSFCNSYGSPYQVRDGVLVLEALGGTDVGCAPEVMEAERAYLQALQGDGAEVTVDADELVLRTGHGELRFRRVPPVPTAELVGTRWVLESVSRGDVTSSVEGDPATLRLGEDGAFTASTGCRTLIGRWRTHGDEVHVPSMRAEGDCPARLRDQDGLVVDALGDGFRAEVDGDRLTVTSVGDVRLEYRTTQSEPQVRGSSDVRTSSTAARRDRVRTGRMVSGVEQVQQHRHEELVVSSDAPRLETRTPLGDS